LSEAARESGAAFFLQRGLLKLRGQAAVDGCRPGAEVQVEVSDRLLFGRSGCWGQMIPRTVVGPFAAYSGWYDHFD